MTDTSLMRAVINQSGYKIYFVAKQLGLSYQGFLNKLRNQSEFTANEICKFQSLLKIDDGLRDRIFFGNKVAETSTTTEEVN